MLLQKKEKEKRVSREASTNFKIIIIVIRWEKQINKTIFFLFWFGIGSGNNTIYYYYW